MPSAIKAIFTGDARQLFGVISELPPRAAAASRGLRQELNRAFAFDQRKSRSTIFNPAPEKDAVREYGQWWERTLTDQSVRAATRSNRARALLRERAQRQEISAERRFQQQLSDSANPALVSMAASGSRGSAINAAASGGLLAGLKNRFLGVGAAIGGVYSAIRLVGASISADIAIQRISNTLKIVSGSAKQAQDDLQFLRKESDRIGVSFMGSADNFARFAVAAHTAGFSTQDTREVFTAISSAAVAMGLGVDQVGGSFLALEQMVSKGKVSMEELRRQLGNALPGAMQIMARAYNISVADLFQKVESGSLDSAEAVRKFAAQLKSEVNITDDANRTIRDINRMQNAWTFFKAAVGEKLRAPTTGILELGTGLLSGQFPGGMLKEVFHSKEVYDLGEARAAISMMEKEVKAAEDLRDALKALVELHPMQRKLTLSEEETKDMNQSAQRMNEQAGEIEEKKKFNALPKEQQIEELKKERARVQETTDFFSKGIQDDIAKNNLAAARLRTAQIDQQLAELTKPEKEKEKSARSNRSGYSTELTANQHIGAFIAGPQMSMLDVEKQQLTEIRGLRNDVRNLNGGRRSARTYGGFRTD